MKIRNGFVSNSSSSSFIVAFPKGFEPTEQNVQEYLFKRTELLEAYGDTVDAAMAAITIAADMKRQTPNSVSDIEDALDNANRLLDGTPGPNWKDFYIDKETSRFDHDAFDKENSAFRSTLIEQIIEKTEGMDLYVFKYSDNDGWYYSVLEHGDIFRSANFSYCVSNH